MVSTKQFLSELNDFLGYSVSRQYANQLLREGRIIGAKKIDNRWQIPDDWELREVKWGRPYSN